MAASIEGTVRNLCMWLVWSLVRLGSWI